MDAVPRATEIATPTVNIHRNEFRNLLSSLRKSPANLACRNETPNPPIRHPNDRTCFVDGVVGCSSWPMEDASLQSSGEFSPVFLKIFRGRTSRKDSSVDQKDIRIEFISHRLIAQLNKLPLLVTSAEIVVGDSCARKIKR